MRYLSVFILITILSLVFILDSRAQEKTESSLTVSAAISLKDSFEEIGRLFQKKHKVLRYSFNFGASGTLQTQIEGGAPSRCLRFSRGKGYGFARKEGIN
jgi:molybdate transport system substrate-binding protein